MRKSTPQSTSHNGTGRELAAIKQLLEVDLNGVTGQQRESVAAVLSAHPGNWQMITGVKGWAGALADVCRRHARDCAQVHASRNDRDPATSAMGTILITLSDHLRLPADGTLLYENWPAENAVRDFALEVAGAPIVLIDGEFVRKPTLPRWEPKSSFARRIAGLQPDPPKGHDAKFLSIEETEKHLRGLEELFRNAMLEGLGTSFSEAVLAICTNHGSHGKRLSPFDREAGKLELGAQIYGYDQDLKRLAQIGRGRRYTQDELKEKRPELQIWDAIERSESLSPLHRREFFETALSAYCVEDRFTFIGRIIGDLSWSDTYELYKAYRASAGLKQNRRKAHNITKPKKIRSLIVE